MADSNNTDNTDDNDDIKKKSLADIGLPSDSELQNTKQQREDWIQKNVVGRLRDAGYPNAGANIGAAAMTANDMVSPNTRDDYVAGMMPAIGEVSGVSPVRSNLGEVASELRGQAVRDPSLLQAVQRDPQAAQAAFDAGKKANRWSAQEIKDVAAGDIRPGGEIAPMENPLKYEAPQGPGSTDMTWSKPANVPTEDVRTLQDQMGSLMDQGKYKEARDMQLKIRQLRENPQLNRSTK